MAESADVVIVGAGAIGSAIAHRLALRGCRSLVLDRGLPGAESSGAAAGILAPRSEAAGPDASYELGARSYALYPHLADELRDATGIDVGLRRSGSLEVAFTDAEAEDLDRRFAWQPSGERIDAAGIRAREPAVHPGAVAAWSFPTESQVDPPRLVEALVAAAIARGAVFRTGAEVRRVIVEGDAVRGVEVDGERIESPTVVLCAGAWSSLIDGAALPRRAVRPVRGQIVQVEQRPPAFRSMVFSHRGYVLARPDGRVICGSTVEDAGFRKDVTVDGVTSILAAARDLVPSLGAAAVTASWSGLRPGTPDGLPILGPGPRAGLVLATGHFRSGVLLAPITAEIVASLVLDGRSPVDLAPFSRSRLS